jgi:type I restriction enzyme, S subunit
VTREHLRWPASWRCVPLWSLFHRVKDVGHPDEQMLSVYRDHGVVQKDARSDNFNKTAENRNIYQLVDEGWLIVNRMKAWQGSLGISPHRGIVSGHYICFRPEHGEDPRFLDYLLRSAAYTAELGRLSRGVRPNQIEIDNDGLRVLPVRLPPLAEQRAIVGFLDTETARIDALVTKKRRLMSLLGERMASAAEVVLGVAPTVAMRRIADTLAGFTFPSETFGSDMPGPRLLRGVNVAPGSIRWDDCVRLASSRTNMNRYELLAGDIVLGMDRPFVGGGTRVALVDESSAGTLLVQRVCRIRAQSQDHAVVLRWALGSPAFRRHVEADLTGVSVPHLSEDQISSFGVPDMTSHQAAKVAQRIRLLEARHEELRARLSRQITLLQEHRQALVTAAVTGAVEVPGVAA